MEEEQEAQRGLQGERETFLAVGPLGTPSASEKPAVLPRVAQRPVWEQGHESAMGPWARAFSSISGMPRWPVA